MLGAVWANLEKATTRDEVDDAFAKVEQDRPMAGLALRAADTGRVPMLQRANTDADPAAGCWEFPGGHVDEGETNQEAAEREWEEETGCELPESAQQVGQWFSTNGVYHGHIYEVPCESELDLNSRHEVVADPDNPEREYFEAAAWWNPGDLSTLSSLRPELKADVASVLHGLQASVLKAGDVGPKAHRWEDFHRNTDRIVDHFTPLVADAMATVLTPYLVDRAIATAYGEMRKAQQQSQTGAPPPPLPPAQAAAVASALGALAASGATIGLSAGAGTISAAAGVGIAAGLGVLAAAGLTSAVLIAVLTELYGDAYLEGAREAAEAAQGSMPPWTATLSPAISPEWGPGGGNSTSQMATGALLDLLGDLDARVQGIIHTELDRIGSVLAAAVATGAPMADAVKLVDRIVHDEKRANLIAETEVARACTVAMLETYRLNNVPQVAWLEQPGACARCHANHEVSPQPTNNQRWPYGPPLVHPRCRCVLIPVIHVPGRPG